MKKHLSELESHMTIRPSVDFVGERNRFLQNVGVAKMISGRSASIMQELEALFNEICIVHVEITTLRKAVLRQFDELNNPMIGRPATVIQDILDNQHQQLDQSSIPTY